MQPQIVNHYNITINHNSNGLVNEELPEYEKEVEISPKKHKVSHGDL